MKKQVLFLDVDGVLLDWFTPFMSYVSQKRSPNRPLATIGDYDYALHPIYGGDTAAFYQDIGEFVNTTEWANLSTLRSTSHTILAELQAMGIDLHVVTQTTAPAAVRLRRVKNLVRQFGPVFSSINFTAHKELKSEKIKNVLSANYDLDKTEWAMVEDCEDKMVDMMDNVIPCFGIRHDYNVNFQIEKSLVHWIGSIDELPLIYAHKMFT